MKCAVWVWEGLGIAFGHNHFGMGAAGNPDHLGRKIQAVRGGATSGRSSGEMAWPARHVEQMLTGRKFSGFQQRFNVGRRGMSKTASVARSGTLPAGMLKGADGLGFKAHKSPRARRTRVDGI